MAGIHTCMLRWRRLLFRRRARTNTQRSVGAESVLSWLACGVTASIKSSIKDVAFCFLIELSERRS
jgi:hypothetical protein